MSSTVVPASVGEGQSAPDMGSEGLDTLLGSSEASFSDDTMDSNAKLSLFVGSVRKFLAGEPGKAKVLGGGLDGSVSSHATFGRMKATVMMSCTCNHMKGGGNDPNPKGAQGAVCCLHIDSPSLADLIFVLSSTVYSVFDDSFMCFANLLVDNVSSGMVRPPLFSFLMFFCCWLNLLEFVSLLISDLCLNKWYRSTSWNFDILTSQAFMMSLIALVLSVGWYHLYIYI